jgi:hypothetical protein
MTSFRLALGPIEPPIQWIQGVPSQEVKLQQREVHHSLPYASEIKKGRTISPTASVVSVLGYRAGGRGSIPGTTRKKNVVGLERGPFSLVSTTEELLARKVAAPV